MCGIFGCFSIDFKNLSIFLEKSGQKSLSLLHHRGPNENGIKFLHQNSILLAHTRLSIIDLKTGKQPIYNGNKSIFLIVNGEIYNYQQLNNRCKSLGIYEENNINTESDSMSIINMYEYYYKDPIQTIRSLDGMFAFVLIDLSDEKHPIVFAGRDHIGIKPLYMGKMLNGKGMVESIAFASEIKCLEGFEVIETFPNGHYYTNKEGIKPYFTPQWKNLKDNYDLSLENEIVVVRDMLKSAVKKRLMSEVELGVFLSGGLDSTIITHLVYTLRDDKTKPLHSFSVGIEDGSDDLIFARKAAKAIGTIHHERFFKLEEVLKDIPKIIFHLESYDPALIFSAIPNYYLSELAAKYVTVVLTGEGADELFCGYKFFEKCPSNEELINHSTRITNLLDSCNLQRNDRMCMAHSLEGRNKFHETFGGVEKYVLRKAFEGLIPQEILFRKKVEFGDGVGVKWRIEMKNHCEKIISDIDFSKRCKLYPIDTPLNKTEFFFRKIFEDSFPTNLFKIKHCQMARWSKNGKIEKSW